MLLGHNLLVIDQISNFMTNDFAIRDKDGGQIGSIVTEGGLGERFFMGSRQFSVYDGEEKILGLYDVPNFGFDTFEITDAAGAHIAQVTKEFAFFVTRLSVELFEAPASAADGEPAISHPVELSGDWLDYDLEATIDGVRAAQVARRWPGLGEWFFGYNRYVLLFERDLPAAPRLGIIGAVIALDLIREKRRRKSASSQ